MSKENGFASFTPAQSKEFIKEQQKNEPQQTFVGQKICKSNKRDSK